MPIEFLPATEMDAEQLVALRIVAMRDSLERIGRFDAQRARHRFLSTYKPQHTRHIVFNGKQVGFLVVKPEGDALLLDHLYIHPDFQGQGIGASALQRVIDEADALSCAVRVGALKGSASNRFYVRHGFTLVDEGGWDNYYVRHHLREAHGTTDMDCER